MTLVEFIAPLRNSSLRDRCLSILYYQHRYESKQALTVEQIRAALKKARIPRSNNINVADLLNKSGHFVDSPGLDGNRRLWKLTSSGETHVRRLLSLPSDEPEIEHEVASLTALAARVPDDDVREYIQEGVKCLRVGGLRAAVVFIWAGAIRTIQQRTLDLGTSRLNTALRKHDPRARQVSRIDDFAYVKDKTVLLAAQELGVFDKGERSTLDEGLDLRNRCGHPTKYKPGVNKASSFIEDVIGTVFG